MNIKLSENELKNLEELINSDDLDCIRFANEIVSMLDEELKLKYEQTVCWRMLIMSFKNSNPWFFE